MGMDNFEKGAYLAASAAVTTGPCKVYSLTAIATASAGTVIVKDGGSGGSVIYQMATPASAGASTSITFQCGLRVGTSLYVTLTDALASISYA